MIPICQRSRLRPLRRVLDASWIHQTQLRSLVPRHYATTNNHPTWFDSLRTEMLGRPPNIYHAPLDYNTHDRLKTSLSTFIPSRPSQPANPILPIGHHLAWFNATVSPDRLLPDGTDALHSPGDPWTRRMWAGGSIQVESSAYYSPDRGMALSTPITCTEEIADVDLRGQDDAAKVFVTIRRTYARQPAQTLMTETRQLVFLKDKSPVEKEAIRTGAFVPVKYIPPPKETPHFALPLTPTRHLLAQYSALTFNAHLIHLDLGYTRAVEGHRNLLVHGPLSLTLMLQIVSDHVGESTEGRGVVRSIQYRNLAPLYCDEEMRICGQLKKEAADGGGVYDVWIEGPTGGVAVKAVVGTETVGR